MAVTEQTGDSGGAGGDAPISTWLGWQRYVDAAPDPGHVVDDSGWDQEQRLDYHSRFVVVSTPAMSRVSTELQRLLIVNRRQHTGARRGLIVSGPPSTGKSTTLTELGRIYELAHRRKHPHLTECLPVAFVAVPPAATPKMLVSEFARFLGLPVTHRMNQAQITDAVCTTLCEAGTRLVLVDDIHLLDTRTRSGAETSDQIKHLGERIPATFVYAGIDVHDSPVLAGPRGQQLAGRFKLLTHDPLPHGTEAQRQVWHEIVGDLENALRLHRHPRGVLTRHAAYLHQRTAGVIGSLVHLIKEAAVIAITDHAEKITKTLLDQIELDIRAQNHYLTPPPRRRPARPARNAQPN